MEDKICDPETEDPANPPLEPPIRDWAIGVLRPEEMTEAERRAEIVMILGKGVLRVPRPKELRADFHI